MNKLLASVAALSLAFPSVASAQGASEALSLKSAAVKQVRASAKPGQKKVAGSSTGLLIGAILLVGAGVALLAGNNSDVSSSR